METNSVTLEGIEYKGKWFKRQKNGIDCWFFEFSILTCTYEHRNHRLLSGLGNIQYLDDSKNMSEDLELDNFGVFIYGFFSLEKGKYTPLSYFSEFKPAK